MVSMKQLLILAIGCLLLPQLSRAQMPQFSSASYADWVYNNPGVELNSETILADRITLYVTSMGLQQTLTSPQFACSAGESIDMRVTWITKQWQDEGFDVNKVSLTAALLDGDGSVVDSTTCALTSVSRTNLIDLTITSPRRLTAARLRFAAWKADVNSCGAVRKIVITSTIKTDVNQDGEVTIADINAIIGVILDLNHDPETVARADVDGDGEVNVADVNAVVKAIVM